MVSVYRGIVLAIAGLILIGASEPPKTGKQSQDVQTAAKIEKAGNSIASAIIQAGKPIEKDGGCEDRNDNRNSDLCAQWKAADAASDAAQYSLLALLISTVGTGLLVWTLWETRQTSRRELRAYVKLVVHDQSIDLTAGKPIKINLTVLNYGHTPALNASFQNACGVAEQTWKWEGDQTATRNKDIAITLHRDAPAICIIQSAFDLTSEMIDDIKNGGCNIFARGTYFYDDVFGSSHFTQISLEVRDIDINAKRIRIAPNGNIST
jgi:hypothetical protein